MADRGVESTGRREAAATQTPPPGLAPAGVAPREGLREARGLEPAAQLPVEAPAGTDPELWSVLTTEERAFYARSHALGPLTYGRGEVQSAQESIGRGGRLDLRV
jgi:hypothetical protein